MDHEMGQGSQEEQNDANNKKEREWTRPSLYSLFVAAKTEIMVKNAATTLEIFKILNHVFYGLITFKLN